jgi:hypothetical protein
MLACGVGGIFALANAMALFIVWLYCKSPNDEEDNDWW